MEVEAVGGAEIMDADVLPNVSLTTARGLALQSIVHFNAKTIVVVSDASGIQADSCNRRGTDCVNGLLWARINSVPEPLLRQLVYAIHGPVEHSCLAAGINQRGRV